MHGLPTVAPFVLVLAFASLPAAAEAGSPKLTAGASAVLHDPFGEDGRAGLLLEGGLSRLSGRPGDKVLSSASFSLGRVNGRTIGAVGVARIHDGASRHRLDYRAGLRSSHGHTRLDLLTLGFGLHRGSRSFTALVDALGGHWDRTRGRMAMSPGVRLGMSQWFFDGAVGMDVGVAAAALLGDLPFLHPAIATAGPGAFVAATTRLNVGMSPRLAYHVGAAYEHAWYRGGGALEGPVEGPKHLTLTAGAQVAFR